MNFSYESILPIAPLKIAALEGCRELAETMDKYLVEFLIKVTRSFRINLISMDIMKTPT